MAKFKVDKGETFTIQKDGVTVSVQFNDGSHTGYVDAGYMEWAYDTVVETTAEAMRLNSVRAGRLGLPQKKDVSKHIAGLVVVLVAAKKWWFYVDINREVNSARSVAFV